MTTYVYETIPQKPGEKPRYFEIKQAMSDQPLTKHPDSGEAIRRVVLGGYGVLSSSAKKSSKGAADGRCCGGSGCCN
jgi:predicted nucleic acid-binding Zn ribbon protein